MKLSHFKDMWALISRDDIPEGSVCNHFGVFFMSDGTSTHIADRGDWTLVTMYDEGYHFDPTNGKWEQPGQSEHVHNARIEMIRHSLEEMTGKEVSVLDQWNGADGSNGVSVVYDVKLPAKYFAALQAYKNVDSFRGKPCVRFDKWEEAHVKGWVEKELKKDRDRADVEREQHDAFDKMDKLQGMGLTDVIDMVMPFIDKDVAKALLAKR